MLTKEDVLREIPVRRFKGLIVPYSEFEELEAIPRRGTFNQEGLKWVMDGVCALKKKRHYPRAVDEPRDFSVQASDPDPSPRLL